jgi:hypothetical protein
MSRRARAVGPPITRLAAVVAALVVAGTLLAAPANAAPVGVNADGMSPNTVAVAAIIRGNEEAAFRYFLTKGLSKKQAAGVVGNLDQESGMDPTIKQFGGGPGRGIAQWSVGGRWDTYSGDNLEAFARTKGVAKLALSTQLDFVWFELTRFSYYGLAQLKASTTFDTAVAAFQNRFEGCGDCNTTARLKFAKDAYARYA